MSKKQITSVGNLTIVSFEPEKEKSVLDERVKNAVRKLLEITSKKAIKEIINSLAGKIASKAFGFVTVDLNVRDKNGFTALRYAQDESEGIKELLLSKGVK